MSKKLDFTKQLQPEMSVYVVTHKVGGHVHGEYGLEWDTYTEGIELFTSLKDARQYARESINKQISYNSDSLSKVFDLECGGQLVAFACDEDGDGDEITEINISSKRADGLLKSDYIESMWNNEIYGAESFSIELKKVYKLKED